MDTILEKKLRSWDDHHDTLKILSLELKKLEKMKAQTEGSREAMYEALYLKTDKKLKVDDRKSLVLISEEYRVFVDAADEIRAEYNRIKRDYDVEFNRLKVKEKDHQSEYLELKSITERIQKGHHDTP